MIAILAIEKLKEEHKVIERILKILTVISQKLEKNEKIPSDSFEKIQIFIKNFADRCHHGKEEDVLFPALGKQGIPKEGGPIGQMLLEHEDGRNFIRTMNNAIEEYKKGDENAKKDIVDNAENYVQLLTQHISKENDILYPIAEETLQSEDNILMEKFEEIERERIGEGKHHEYLHLVEELEKEFGIS